MNVSLKDGPLGSKHVAILKNTKGFYSIHQLGGRSLKDRVHQLWQYRRGRCVHMLNTYVMTQHKHYTVIPR
jgi:hypothetical protein